MIKTRELREVKGNSKGRRNIIYASIKKNIKKLIQYIKLDVKIFLEESTNSEEFYSKVV